MVRIVGNTLAVVVFAPSPGDPTLCKDHGVVLAATHAAGLGYALEPGLWLDPRHLPAHSNVHPTPPLS